MFVHGTIDCYRNAFVCLRLIIIVFTDAFQKLCRIDGYEFCRSESNQSSNVLQNSQVVNVNLVSNGVVAELIQNSDCTVRCANNIITVIVVFV